MVPLLLAALAGGALLFLADHPVGWSPLALGALAPLLVALRRHTGPAWQAALAGLLLGLAYYLPLLAVLRFPLHLGLGLAAALSLGWCLWALAARPLLRMGPVTGALGAAALAAVIAWLSYVLVPMWGAAQLFVRVLAPRPSLTQLVSLGGATLLVFFVVALQALATALLGRSSTAERRRVAAALGLLVAVAAGWSLWRLSRPAAGTLRVAAIGWTHADEGPAGARFAALHEPLIRRAAAAGARLVVTPEAALHLGAGERDAVLGQAARLARELGVRLALGYFDLAGNDNHLRFLDETGASRGDYRKTHLIPFLERYRAGDGTTVVWDGPPRLGGMICQDDNFTDLARAYGRAGVAMVTVPTDDWREVAPYHFHSSRLRAVEQGYGLVRAATDGTSAVVGPTGRLLAVWDPFVGGPGLAVADLPYAAAGTPYSHLGDWPVWLSLAGLAVLVWRRRRRGR